jgi:hypothetical protein
MRLVSLIEVLWICPKRYYIGQKNLFNPLNHELSPICHLLVLLGDLTFMGPCIVSVF